MLTDISREPFFNSLLSTFTILPLILTTPESFVISEITDSGMLSKSIFFLDLFLYLPSWALLAGFLSEELFLITCRFFFNSSSKILCVVIAASSSASLYIVSIL